jgi:hypothetical protein
MSKQKLQAQLENIKKPIQGYRKDTVDRKKHIHVMEVSSIVGDIRHQIAFKTRKNKSKERILLENHLESTLSSKIGKLVVRYIVQLRKNLLSINNNRNLIAINNKDYAPNSAGYAVEIYDTEGKVSIFEKIKTARKGPLTALKQDLFKLLYDEIQIYQKLSTSVKKQITGTMRENIFGKKTFRIDKNTGKKITFYAGGLLETGHGEDSSVVKKELDESFGAIEDIAASLSSYNIKEVMDLNAFVTKNRVTNKELVITFDQSKQKNNAQAKDEGLLRAAAKTKLENSIKAIDKYIKGVGIEELANLETSSGQVDKVIGTITEVLSSSGAKISSDANKKRSAPKSKELSRATTTINDTIQVNTIITKESIKSRNKIDLSPVLDGLDASVENNSGNTNWASLITIINAKLPERVAKNMVAPGLVYRTGRFAQSAKVVNVQTTKEGYPSVVFDYQRDPYDVFDSTKGAAPWKTPARDPRALVDRSVREIVQEMAIGRFYTRRA